MESATPASLLEVRGLRTHFYTDEGIAPAVDGIDLEILPGQTLGLVGESGCGKSVTGLSLLRLVSHPGRIVGGEIRMRGQNLLDLPMKEMRKLRGEQIAMIFQEPMTSLDPLYAVRDPLLETLRLHRKMSRSEARAKAVQLLTSVGIIDAERRVDSYPHELSGGMRQRVMIASAIACDPAVLIADEPTTALDVTVQAQILALLRKLQAENGMAILLITHNLGIVAENCHQVAVMYAGKIVEKASMRSIFQNPRHPYTQGLLRAVPRLDHPVKQPLPTIPGSVPNLLHLPTGCRFRSRCVWAQQKCAEEEPPLQQVEGGHTAACWVLPAYTQSVPTTTGATV
ncbi:MAG: oligopeptide/dipeptide transporter, ATPase subunit [Chthonomonadales bacterium]|nr:oligopeptide/dipeptide transporter, ATPase subunit [Chthonomonadales bacterium]